MEKCLSQCTEVILWKKTDFCNNTCNVYSTFVQGNLMSFFAGSSFWLRSRTAALLWLPSGLKNQNILSTREVIIGKAITSVWSSSGLAGDDFGTSWSQTSGSCSVTRFFICLKTIIMCVCVGGCIIFIIKQVV